MCSADMCGVCFAPLWNLFYWVSSKKSEHFTADARARRALGVLEGSSPVNMLSNPSTCVFLWNCGRKDGIVYLVQLESDVEDDSLIIEQACQEDDTSLRVRAGSERVWVCVNYRFDLILNFFPNKWQFCHRGPDSAEWCGSQLSARLSKTTFKARVQ